MIPNHPNMLSKSQISFVTSLQQKKFRKQYGLFIVEGIKSVLEFVRSEYIVETIFATASGWTKLGKIPENIKSESVTEKEFGKLSLLDNPQGALALVRIPETSGVDDTSLATGHTLVLDDIQDPGNMGTIIRTAEWFGFSQIICSIGTVDVYNPKVVQATMGSLSRIQVVYTDLQHLVEQSDVNTYGALLNGTSIYETDFGVSGLIILGNEGNGIHPKLVEKIDHAVTIPLFGKAESLNVAVAATIFCSEIARKKLEKK